MIIGKKINQGHTSEIFEVNNNYILKLYKSEFQFLIEHEFKVLKMLNEINFNAPKCYDMIVYKDKQGIVMQHLKGVNLNTYIKNYPFEYNSIIDKYSNLFISTYELKITLENTSKMVIAKRLENVKKVDSSIVDFLLKILKNYQFSNTFVHGELHPGNIIVVDGNLYAIDWQYARTTELEEDIAYFKAQYVFGDDFYSKRNIIMILFDFYKQFLFNSFYKNIENKINIDDMKISFWSLIHNILITEGAKTPKKILSNMKIIESDFNYLKSTF